MPRRIAALLSVALSACASPPAPDCPPTPPPEAAAAAAAAAPTDPANEHARRGSAESGSSEGASPEGGSPESRAHHGGGHHRAEVHGPLVRRFDNADDWVDHFEGPDRDAWQKPAEVVKAMGVTEGMTVADIGAGTGYFLPHLSRAVGEGGRVIAVDIEPAMVEHMIARVEEERLDNTHPQLGALDNPMLFAESVDRILIVDTWHHIPARDDYAETLAAALTPGGALFVVDFTQDTERGPPKKHRVKPAEVLATLEDAGLTTRLDEALLPEQFVAIGTKPKRN